MGEFRNFGMSAESIKRVVALLQLFLREHRMHERVAGLAEEGDALKAFPLRVVACKSGFVVPGLGKQMMAGKRSIRSTADFTRWNHQSSGCHE